MTEPKRAWMVRAGDNNELADQVEEKKAVAIGWAGVGDLSDANTREQVKERYTGAHPDQSASRVNVNSGQLYRFAHEIAEGDYVLTYEKATRELLLGACDGKYACRPTLFDEMYPHIRPVRWLGRASRDTFSSPARNTMGSSLTVFNLDHHLVEIHSAATGEALPDTDEPVVDTPPFFEEVKAKADELVADLISRIDPYEFQDLVAGLLQAMGFQAVSSPPGADRGVDILAHPDPFGFERPRIKVQVKHRRGSAGGPELRQFLGTLRSGDSGLYVSTGGFSRDAKLEAERSREPLALLNADDFIRLLLDHYEALDPEYKAQIPLRKVWLPTE